MHNTEGLEPPRVQPAAPSTGQAVSNSNFLREVLGELAVGQHGWVCTFTGDPHQAPPTVWGGRTFKGGPGASAVIDRASDQNAYFSVAVLQADPTEGVARRAGAFVRLAALVADDVDPQGLHGHSWLLETSSGKHQAGVIIDPQDPDAADRDLVDRLLRAVPGAAGADQSGNACVRYARLPQGLNGKPKAQGFAVRLRHWQPGQVLSLEDAAAVFGVDLDALRSPPAVAPCDYKPNPEVRSLQGVAQGGRNELLFKFACSLRARNVDFEEAQVLLLHRAGQCSPPLQQQEAMACLRSAYKYEAGKSEAFLADRPHSVRKLTPAAACFNELRPAKWVLQGFVAAGELVTFAGLPGVGKSTVFASLALVVSGYGQALGSDLTNDRPRRVGIVTENPAQYERIIYALCKRHALDATAVALRVRLYSTTRLLADEVESEIGAIVDELHEDEPPLIIIDTASASFELESENDNAQVGRALSQLRPLAERSGSPVWIITHAAKAISRQDSDITPRGAGAWVGDVHGNGSVFREPDRPGSVFIRSLKNRWERDFDEIEVCTSVTTHEVIDERGAIQELRIRIGLPRKAAVAAEQRQEQRRKADVAASTYRAAQWIEQTLRTNPQAPTSQHWLETAAKDAQNISRAAVRAALESLQQKGRITLQPIRPKPKNGARERFVLVEQAQAAA